MPRKPRVVSDSGMYHILLRCVKNDKFFCDDKDYNKFLELLKENKAECGYKLYAYVLCEKEIRLLIKAENVGIENIFKRLCVKYTYWYNCKYQRSGSLFFDRFKSEPVEDDAKFDEVYRYIIKYPVLEGICSEYKQYKYSNFASGFEIDIYREVEKGFLDMDVNESHLKTVSQKNRLTDETALEIILDTMKKASLNEVSEMPADKKYACAKELIDKGIGYRQLSRLTGMNYLTVKRYIEEDEDKMPVRKKKTSAGNIRKSDVKKAEKKSVKKVETEIIDFFSI